MRIERVLLGFCAGLSAGYVALRCVEAVREWQSPSPQTRKSPAEYARARRSSAVAETLRGLAGGVVMAYGPLGEALDRATLHFPVWSRPFPFAIAVSAGSALAELPVSFIEDYARERRCGLSDQSREAWLRDYVKGAAISVATTALVATLFGWAVRRAPNAWPWLASAGTLPLLVLGNIVVPLYVMPLFNTFEPVTGSLERRVRALGAEFGVGDAEILRMDMSRQTRKANAFVTGIGRTHRIVLGDTLIDTFPEDEVAFVVAHEIGHYASRDTWRLMFVGEAVAAALFVIARLATPETVRQALRDRPLLVARLYATMLVATQALRPLLFGFSRSREWTADRFAIGVTRDRRAGAAALRRLRDQNLADEDPPYWYELLFGSHPSLRARIAELESAGS